MRLGEKKLACSVREKVALVELAHPYISVSSQAALLRIARSSVYYLPRVNAEEVTVTRVIDEIYTTYPFYGSRKIKAALARRGYRVRRERVQKLMRAMGIEAIYPKPKGSQRHPDHHVFRICYEGSR